MMLASNNGVGMNIGFPDVCLTPAAPAPIPVPYPNLAMNAMAVPFSPNIFVGFMPSVTMASKIPMTMGDEGGVAHPLFKQMGQYTMGNPTILVNCCPAINMLCPTSGNMMNNPVGAALVPSVTTTFYTDASVLAARSAERVPPQLDAEALAHLSEVSAGSADDVEARDAGDLVLVRIRRFSSTTATRVFADLRSLRPFGGSPGEVRRQGPSGWLAFDLRGNPGGDVDGCLALLDDLLPRGVTMVLREDGEGDRVAIQSRHDPVYTGPVAVLVDRHTASAAEIFAAALQAHGRASVWGERTAGKTTAQQVLRSTASSGRVYGDVARFLRHDGAPIHGEGVEPDARLHVRCSRVESMESPAHAK